MSTPDSDPLPPVTRPQCGTYAGVAAHGKNGEHQCDACKPVDRAYVRAARLRGRCARGLGWPLGPNDPAPRGPVKRLPPRWAR